jgi:hypothetical protein
VLDGVTLPVPVQSVKPVYTSAAMDAHVEGTVGLDVVVLADGKVGDVMVTQSLDKEYGLDSQAPKPPDSGSLNRARRTASRWPCVSHSK